MPSPAPASPAVPVAFSSLALAPAVLRVLADVGYEAPSPIQAATIPPLLEGRDVLGQAQTGTGKTAAFALPILSKLDAVAGKPQALVLAPTRELAIQVAEAFQRYAAHLKDFRVLPIYGGQGYGPQLHGLRRGVHVVVGTPGRIVDHLKKGTLDLSALRFLVLDEADEMLRMGFAEDVDQVLAATPATRQVALFSATMPAQIRRIAKTHLKDPVEISIAAKTTTAINTRQRYWWVSGVHKLDALTRILEAEPFDAMIVFARTKQATEELAGKLQARGLAAAAINGDIAQPQRERVIQQLRDGSLDILVATDVAARGLDVDRISHVLNYDIPYDTESYVHRIGRTGRAGRSGEAILFVTPREQGMLRAIERATRQPITQMHLPTVEAVNDRRIARFKERIDTALEAGGLDVFRGLIEQYEQEHDVPARDIAAALARIAQGDTPLLLDPPRQTPREPVPRREVRKHEPRAHAGEAGKDTYRLEVGHAHGVKPGNIIGAIANETGMDSKYIGRLSIHDNHSLVDLPEGLPMDLLEHLKKVRVVGQPLRISRQAGTPPRKPFKRPR
ncbi:MAG TPA: DEAD/DEAH box helicase [Rhodanobacteraceae bacterium]|nr:DEAD/DEAH box helicase [Rhodanobacteraceae bacterium]